MERGVNVYISVPGPQRADFPTTPQYKPFEAKILIENNSGRPEMQVTLRFLCRL